MQLAEHRFFAPFDPEVSSRLQSLSVVSRLADGQMLFLENDPADAIYLVLEGRVELARMLPGDRLEPVAYSPAGDYFGELAVLDGSGRSTCARAAGPAVVARLPGEDFMQVLRDSPGRAALAIYGKIIQNIRDTNDRFIAHKLSQEKLSLVGEMAGSIVHDLRGPYTGIKLAIEEIQEQHSDHPETAELCQLVTEQIRRSVGMLDEVLQFTRGTTKLDRTRVGLDELLQKFYRLNKEFVSGARVELLVEAPRDVVEVDQDKLTRVLQNLVNNAVEALGRAGGHITVRGQAVEGGHEIVVADDGPGIPEAIRERVFQPFVTHGKSNGTGLGMAITKSIVEAHKGRISFSTKSGVGTTFRIFVPS